MTASTRSHFTLTSLVTVGLTGGIKVPDRRRAIQIEAHSHYNIKRLVMVNNGDI